MITKHLNDTEIQEYALDKAGCDQYILDHMIDCSVCQSKTAAYTVLFKVIKLEEKPVFDFNLSDLVMAQLPQEKIGVRDKYFVYIMVVAANIITAAMLYWYRKYLINLFSGNEPILTWLIVSAILCLSIFLGIDMYRKYKRQMDALNFY